MPMFKSTKPVTNEALAKRFREICEHVMAHGGNYNIHHNDMKRDVNSMGYDCNTNGSDKQHHFRLYARAWSYTEPEVYLVHNRHTQSWELWFNRHDYAITQTTRRHVSHYVRALNGLTDRNGVEIPVYLVSIGAWRANTVRSRMAQQIMDDARDNAKWCETHLAMLGGRFIKEKTIRARVPFMISKMMSHQALLTDNTDPTCLGRIETEAYNLTLGALTDQIVVAEHVMYILDTHGLKAAKAYCAALDALEWRAA